MPKVGGGRRQDSGNLTRRELVGRALAGCAALASGLASRQARADDEAQPDGREALLAELPSWAAWTERDLACDVDGDGEDETLALHGMRFEATDGDAVLLETPEEWLVADVLAGDLDADGLSEVVLLVWKRGSFGAARPFWVEEGAGDDEPSQHLFVYRWRDGALQPVWMSSALGVEVVAAELADAPDTSTPLLLLTSPDGGCSAWEWGTWGFVLVEGVSAASEDGCSRLTLLAVGDNIAHANIYEGAYDAATRTFDFSPLYEHVRDLVGSCDVAAVCQETPLVADPALRSSYPRFATPSSMGDALADAGFDAVLAATNHVNDAGATGLEDTLAFWEESHPEVALLGLHAVPEDEGKPAFVEANGVRLALFDYTYGLNGLVLSEDDPYRVDVLDDEGTARLLSDVAGMQGEVDATVCFLHIGEEYRAAPTEEQRALARQLVEAGADAVVCSHTHVLGPYGTQRGSSGRRTGAVFFGLGNFMSGQCLEAATVVGGAAVLEFEKRTGTDGAAQAALASYRLVPLVCHTDAAGRGVAVYPLDDYTDELAAEHLLSAQGEEALTVARLRAQVKEGLAGATDVSHLAG